MAHTIKNKQPLLTRVRRIKGQMAAIEQALEQEHECIAVLQQVAAIRGAVNGLTLALLEDHIRDHLGPEVPAEQRAAEQEQVIQTLRSYLK